MNSKKSKKLTQSIKGKLFVMASLIILTMSFLSGCGSDEVNEYQNTTTDAMKNATDYVDKARDVAGDADAVEDQTLDLDE